MTSLTIDSASLLPVLLPPKKRLMSKVIKEMCEKQENYCSMFCFLGPLRCERIFIGRLLPMLPRLCRLKLILAVAATVDGARPRPKVETPRHFLKQSAADSKCRRHRGRQVPPSKSLFPDGSDEIEAAAGQKDLWERREGIRESWRLTSPANGHEPSETVRPRGRTENNEAKPS